MRKISASLFALPVVALLTFAASCNKLSKATYVAPTSDTVVVKNNVIVVDSTKYKLISTNAELKNGTYIYKFQASATDLQHNGDFAPGITLVGITGKGYLRKIVSVTSTSETITVNTMLGKLEDVVAKGKVEFTTGTSHFRNGINYEFNNLLLSQHLGTDITLATGNISLVQNWAYTMQFNSGGLTSFVADSKGGSFSADAAINVAGGSSASLVHVSDTLDTYSRLDKIMVGKVPMILSTEICLVAVADGSTNGLQNHTYSLHNNAAMDMNASYSSGNWQNSLTTSGAAASLTGNTSSSPQVNMNCNLVSVLNVRLNGEIISSNVTPLNTNINANLSATTSDWDFSSHSVLQPTVNENTALISYSASELNKTWNADSAVLITPYQVLKAGGDNQTGSVGNYLPQPIVVKVVDNNGNGQAGVMVHFRVVSGGGALSYANILSDVHGLATAYWQFGNGGSGQKLEATAKNASGNNIMGTPMVFTAN